MILALIDTCILNPFASGASFMLKKFLFFKKISQKLDLKLLFHASQLPGKKGSKKVNKPLNTTQTITQPP